MEYIQLDNFNGDLNIVCKDDGSGEPLVFESLKEAQDTLEDNCQDGQIIPLGVNIIELLKACKQVISDNPEDLTEALDEVLDNH